jgi:hypothetical protein
MKKITLLVLATFLTVLFGCQRDTSDVKKAIIGHWKTYEYMGKGIKKGKEINVYISETEITTIDNEGTESTVKYKIAESNEKKGVLAIITYDTEDKPFAEEYKFLNGDRTKIKRMASIDSLSVSDNMTESEKYAVEVSKSMFSGIDFSDKVVYVDDKTKP